jgi:hypothetical protein
MELFFSLIMNTFNVFMTVDTSMYVNNTNKED